MPTVRDIKAPVIRAQVVTGESGTESGGNGNGVSSGLWNGAIRVLGRVLQSRVRDSEVKQPEYKFGFTKFGESNSKGETTMSLGSFLKKLEDDAKNFENVAVKDEQKMVAFFEKVIGKAPVDNTVATIETTLETDIGKLTKKGVLMAESIFGKAVSGPTKANWVMTLVTGACSALGIPFSGSAVNMVLNMLAPFVENKLDQAVQAVVKAPAA